MLLNSFDKEAPDLSSFMHIRNLTICFEIYRYINSCHVAVKIWHLPMLHSPYTRLCLGLVGMDSCGLLSARTYQLTDQSVPLSLWEAGCIQHALRHTVNTVTFRKTKDLQNIIRHTAHRKVKAMHCKWDGLTFSVQWQRKWIYILKVI